MDNLGDLNLQVFAAAVMYGQGSHPTPALLTRLDVSYHLSDPISQYLQIEGLQYVIIDS